MKDFKYILIIAFFSSLPIWSYSQGQGIRFEQELSFQQIIQKARTENKYVFVDCYASWCGPCKKMDQNVYPNDTVGQFFNRYFISIKLQMDTSKQDGDEAKSHYGDAHQLLATYKVKAFPTYLFFAPDGKIMHRGLGYQAAADFVKLAGQALDPSRQYYTLLDEYEKGRRDSTALYLVTIARAIGDEQLAVKIGSSYVSELLKLPASKLYSGDKYNLIVASTQSSKDSGFYFLYTHAAEMDKALGRPLIAEGFISYIISKEMIDPITKATDESRKAELPWKSIYARIEKKYNRFYADETITNGRIRWYGYKKNWPLYCKYLVYKAAPNFRTLSTFDLNEDAWEIFQHSYDPKQLRTAIAWAKLALEKEPANDMNIGPDLDTYANLLYKLGERQKAAAIEQKALATAEKMHISFNIKEFTETLQKMRAGQPTW